MDLDGGKRIRERRDQVSEVKGAVTQGENQQMRTPMSTERRPTSPEPGKLGEIQKETYYKATLPCGRKCELRNETFSVWTRAGEELALGFEDLSVMLRMRDAWKTDRER